MSCEFCTYWKRDGREDGDWHKPSPEIGMCRLYPEWYRTRLDHTCGQLKLLAAVDLSDLRARNHAYWKEHEDEKKRRIAAEKKLKEVRALQRGNVKQ